MTRQSSYQGPPRRGLMLEQWPAQDREAWGQIFCPGDILDGTAGAGAHWSPQTRKNCCCGYGNWLMFLMTSGRFDPDTSPTERITPEAVRAYIETLQTEVQSWTVWGRLVALQSVARAMATEGDWSWLRRVVRHLEGQLRGRDKRSRLRDAGEIVAAAYVRMDELQTAEPWQPLASVHYRDALMVALLIHCPTMRLANLTMIEVNRHLRYFAQGYQLVFEPYETKTRKPFLIPVPDSLRPYLDHYLEHIRPALLGDKENKNLWISKSGDALARNSVYGAIVKTTEQLLGVSINPHLFRDCAATTIAIQDPEHIGIASQILGHTDPGTTEHHYIQANALIAGRKLRRSIDSLRQELHPRRAHRHIRHGEDS